MNEVTENVTEDVQVCMRYISNEKKAILQMKSTDVKNAKTGNELRSWQKI